MLLRACTSHLHSKPLFCSAAVLNRRLMSSSWSVRGTSAGVGAVNAIRQCEEAHFVEALKQRNKELDLIKLSIGDPTVFGNLPADPTGGEAIKAAIDSGQYNGYGHSRGLLSTREAVARKYGVVNEATLTEEDVIMTSSCSGALELCFTALASAGQNFLIPKPGFALYRCQLGSLDVELRYYSLKPDANWEVDLTDMERLIDSNTAGILINNPSNPCGSVYTQQHLRDIADIACKHRLPIISDETYAEMVFTGHKFHSIAAVANDVPTLVCGGISKRFLVPGWRLGWILIHDPIDAFRKEVRPGLFNLAMKILGPCTLVQAAVPDMLEKTPEEFHKRTIDVFEENARLVYDGLKDVPGLNPIMPSGAMYMMVGIDKKHFPTFSDDIQFTKQLVIEQSVFCLPGDIFTFPDYFRIVLVMPPDRIREACQRIATFCKQNYQ